MLILNKYYRNVYWSFHIDFITEALNAFIKQIAFIKFANKGGNNISNATKLNINQNAFIDTFYFTIAWLHVFFLKCTQKYFHTK